MLEVKDDTNELEHAKSAESNDSNLRKLNIPDIWAGLDRFGSVLDQNILFSKTQNVTSRLVEGY